MNYQAIDRCDRKMAYARNAALFIAIINLLIVLKLASGAFDQELLRSGGKQNAVAWPFFLTVSFSAVAFGLHLRSRIAALAAPCILAMAPVWVLVLKQQPQGLFTYSVQDAPMILLMLAGVGLGLLFCFATGIVGVFEYHRLLKNTNQT
jgi:hypothetical protein